jgi:hypothetical protein
LNRLPKPAVVNLAVAPSQGSEKPARTRQRRCQPFPHRLSPPDAVAPLWEPPSAFGNAVALVAAVALAGVAAFFSVTGMVEVFPGAPVAVIVLAGSMEAGKLVIAAISSTANLGQTGSLPIAIQRFNANRFHADKPLA